MGGVEGDSGVGKTSLIWWAPVPSNDVKTSTMKRSTWCVCTRAWTGTKWNPLAQGKRPVQVPTKMVTDDDDHDDDEDDDDEDDEEEEGNAPAVGRLCFSKTKNKKMCFM